MRFDLRAVPRWGWYAMQLASFAFVVLPLSWEFGSVAVVGLFLAFEGAIFVPVIFGKGLRVFFGLWSVQIFLIILLSLLFDFQNFMTYPRAVENVTIAAFVFPVVAIELLVAYYILRGERSIPRILQMCGASTAVVVVLIVVFIMSQGIQAFKYTPPQDFILDDEWRLQLEMSEFQSQNISVFLQPYALTFESGFDDVHVSIGMVVPLNFTLRNVGGAQDAYSVSLDATAGLRAMTNDSTVSLGSYETHQIEVRVVADAPGPHSLALRVASQNSTLMEEKRVDILVGGAAADFFPEFDSVTARGLDAGNVRRNLTLSNFGQTSHDYILSLDGPSTFLPYVMGGNISWDYVSNSGTISLMPGESSLLEFVPRITSYGAASEGTYGLWLNVTSGLAPEIIETYEMQFTYIDKRELFVTSQSAINISSTDPVTIDLKVIGGEIDTYDIVLEGVEPGWNVTVAGGNGTLFYGNGKSSFLLGDGVSNDLEITVSASGAAVGDEIVLSVTIGKGVSRSNFGILPFIVGTIATSAIAIAIAAPLGIGCAAFLSDYCPDRIHRILRPLYELLAGIPSVIYGLWGFLVFGPFLAKYFYRPIGVDTIYGEAILTASIVLSIMILPIIITLSEDAMRAVKRDAKEGALALGSTRWQVIKSIVIPGAKSGIVASIILALGRAIGETMAVLMIMGATSKMPESVFDPSGTMTSVIAGVLGWAYTYDEIRYALFAVASILFLMVFTLNFIVFKFQRSAESKGNDDGLVKKAGRAVAAVTRRASLALKGIASKTRANRGSLARGKTKFVETRVLRRNEAVAKAAMIAGALCVTGFLFLIIGDIMVNGGLSIKPEYIYTREGFGGIEGGFANAITGSLMLVGIALAFAAPLALGSAIYVNEYAKPGNRLTNAILFASDTLASTPSIVFGAFGFMFFVLYLRFGFSLLAGGLTLGLMIIPLLLRSSIEALKSIPKDYREASLALGATKWQTIRDAVLPPSMPMISSGVIISIGRAIGETAAILFTAGYTAHVTTSLMEPAASMPNMIFIYYDLSTTFPVLQEKVYSAAFVLIVLVLTLNGIARLVARRASRHSR